MVPSAPAMQRGTSRSSMQTSHSPSCLRASQRLATAATSEPACRGPVGDGANRPRYEEFGESMVELSRSRPSRTYRPGGNQNCLERCPAAVRATGGLHRNEGETDEHRRADQGKL